MTPRTEIGSDIPFSQEENDHYKSTLVMFDDHSDSQLYGVLEAFHRNIMTGAHFEGPLETTPVQGLFCQDGKLFRELE